MAHYLPTKLRRLYQRAHDVIAGRPMSQHGQAFAEYALLLAVLVLAMIGVLMSFGQSVGQFMLDAACYGGLGRGC